MFGWCYVCVYKFLFCGYTSWYFFVHYAVPKMSTFQPADKAALQNAVQDWGSDNATALTTYGEINTWDASLITDMSTLFDGMVSFNDDIGNWDTSSVTNMGAMFFSANSFNQNIGSWDIGAVTTFTSMFSGNPMAILQAGGAANRLAIHAAWSSTIRIGSFSGVRLLSNRRLRRH
jgi:surface protein